jgi:hypothetical protein
MYSPSGHRLVGADPCTARRWSAGERTVPEPVAIILRLMLAGVITETDVHNAKGKRA